MHTGCVPSPPSARATVREVLGVREFQGLLASSALSMAGDHVNRIAVAVLVYQRTGSPLAVTAAVACSYLTWLVGGPLLAALADRTPRRRLMLGCDLLRAALVALLVLPDVPLVLVFGVLVLVGVLSPPFDAARSALLPDVLTGDRYVVGNALQGTVFQAAQVAGFLVGGAVVAAVGVRGAMALDSATFLLSAAVLALRVHERPVPERAEASLLADTAAGMRVVAREPRLRRLLAFGLLGALVMIAPEGLAVPVADGLGGGPRTAGVLIAAVPAGFLVGSFLVLRVAPERREGLLPGLVVTAAAALLLTPVLPTPALVAGAWAVCGAGGALGLIANAAYMQAVPARLRGRAFGVAATALMAGQGLVLLVLGAVATQLGAPATVAAAGVAALLGLVPLVVQARPRALVAAGS